jgi:hypothetical protein
MSEYDPFASAPADDEAQAAPVEAPAEEAFSAPPADVPTVGAVKVDVKPNLVGLGSDGKVVLTFKGGTGFDAPWIVIHATSLDDAFEQVSGENAVLLAQLMERVQKAGEIFAGLSTGKPAAARPQRQAAPAPAQQPPAGSPPSPGEGWVYKTGVAKSGPKAGQPWQAWMPPQHLKDAGTKPVWF